jgi:hypothetical protein
MAEIKETVGQTSGQIDIAQVMSPAEIADEAAKQLVVSDARTTRSFISSRFFQIRWLN